MRNEIQPLATSSNISQHTSSSAITSIPSSVHDDLEPPRVPQQARSRAKRDRLLAAALALFSERGYEATTVDAIADAAGVSVGIFYSYFRSKRQILLTLANEHVEQVWLDLSVLQTGPLTIARIEQTLLTLLREARQHAGLHRAQRELTLTDPDASAFERARSDEVCAALADGIEQRRHAGELRADLDSAATALTVLALFTSLRDAFADRADAELAPVAASAARMIYHTLVPDPQ